MGSLLLTRSFTIKAGSNQDPQTRESQPGEVSGSNVTTMDDCQDLCHDPELVNLDDDKFDEDEEEVVILPLADMLNARYGQENVCFPWGCQAGYLMF